MRSSMFIALRTTQGAPQGFLRGGVGSGRRHPFTPRETEQIDAKR
ncbi:MAG: hypothetical protein R2788_17150 [Saprospiraceae bacterium]